MLTAKRFKLTRRKMLSYLDGLDAADEQAITLYLPAGVAQAEISAHLERVPAVASIRIELSKGISASQTGAVLLWGQSRRLILPPFPQREKYLTSGYDVSPLRLLLTRDFRIGIVLVRLGSFSIGVCEGDRLIEHKAGTGLVHGRHRQGGSSAARFQRRRGEQAHQFLLRVAGHAEEKLALYAKTLDFLVYGGARTTIQELRKLSKFLVQFDDRLLPPLLSIPDPRYEVLEEAVTDIWSSHVTEWLEDPAD
jgi:hypothetical protein